MPTPRKTFKPDGPIPGENFTSDTRNYPWHRAPEITDLDAGIEASIKQLTERASAYSLLTMLQSGVTCVQATDIFVTSGIGAGKWTPDMALLLAGPVSHMIKLMADGYGIKYDMGLEDDHIPTIAFLKAKAEIDPMKAVEVADHMAEQKSLIVQKAGSVPQAGFMGQPGPDLGKEAIANNQQEQATPAPTTGQPPVEQPQPQQGMM